MKSIALHSNLPKDWPLWSMTYYNDKTIKIITENSGCPVTIYPGDLSLDPKSIINMGHQSGNELAIQIGGEIRDNFASRRPLIHLNSLGNMVQIKLHRNWKYFTL